MGVIDINGQQLGDVSSNSYLRPDHIVSLISGCSAALAPTSINHTTAAAAAAAAALNRSGLVTQPPEQPRPGGQPLWSGSGQGLGPRMFSLPLHHQQAASALWNNYRAALDNHYSVSHPLCKAHRIANVCNYSGVCCQPTGQCGLRLRPRARPPGSRAAGGGSRLPRPPRLPPAGGRPEAGLHTSDSAGISQP